LAGEGALLGAERLLCATGYSPRHPWWRGWRRHWLVGPSPSLVLLGPLPVVTCNARQRSRSRAVGARPKKGLTMTGFEAEQGIRPHARRAGVVPSLVGKSPARTLRVDLTAVLPPEDEDVQWRRPRRFRFGKQDVPVASPGNTVPRQLTKHGVFKKKDASRRRPIPTGCTRACTSLRRGRL
jgi:hypothetical protein